MALSFSNKLIDIQIDLANGQFGGGGNSMTLTGLRVNATVLVVGGAHNGSIEAAIYGMSLSDMNQLSMVGTQLNSQPNNQILVTAGDEDSGMATIYQGTLFSAYVDAQAMPQVAFRVAGQAGLYQAVMPTTPISMQGQGDVATMMGQVAQAMGMQFENNSVNVQLANPYYAGTPRMQALSIAQDAGIMHIIDKGTLAIWMPGQARQGSTTIMISPETGMVGYPIFNQAQVIVKTVFDPDIQYGGTMQIQSDLTPACGTWTITNVVLELDAMTPHGRWFATLTGVQPQAAQIEP